MRIDIAWKDISEQGNEDENYKKNNYQPSTGIGKEFVMTETEKHWWCANEGGVQISSDSDEII